MGKVGGVFVRVCTSLQDWPAAVLCISLSILQMAVLDYYLVEHDGNLHFAWIGFDAINVTLLGITIYQARRAIRGSGRPKEDNRICGGSLGWVAWLCMAVSVAAKTVFIFDRFASELDEEDPGFWGPNTLKTTIALGACTFITLLITQHDAPPGSDGRRYIEELTGSVAFDILDTVDILEVLFDEDMRPKLWSGLEEFILSVGVLNLLLPTVPLLTLARSKFGAKKLSKRLVKGHRLLLVLAVNVPNLLVRMLLWHGLSAGVSPFTLKNIIAILLTLYEFYEHTKEVYEERMKDSRDAHEDDIYNGKALHEDMHMEDLTDHKIDQYRSEPSQSPYNNNKHHQYSPDSDRRSPRASGSADEYPRKTSSPPEKRQRIEVARHTERGSYSRDRQSRGRRSEGRDRQVSNSSDYRDDNGHRSSRYNDVSSV